MYQGGVVLSVDSRATGGEFIGSQTMKKIVEINDFMLGIVEKPSIEKHYNVVFFVYRNFSWWCC